MSNVRRYQRRESGVVVPEGLLTEKETVELEMKRAPVLIEVKVQRLALRTTLECTMSKFPMKERIKLLLGGLCQFRLVVEDDHHGQPAPMAAARRVIAARDYESEERRS